MKKVLFRFLPFILSSLILGCQNFLDGSDLKNNLDEKINYEKSSPVNIKIVNVNENIKITSVLNHTLKITDSISIDYNYDSKIFETAWKILDKDGKEIENTDKIIKIETKETSSSVDSHSSKITLLSNKYTDLQLKLISEYLPQVLDSMPKESVTGVVCYRAIIIEFATPMNNEDLSDFTNIEIKDSNGKSLTDYFMNPVLSEDGKTLKITPKRDKIFEIISETETKKISVTLKASIKEKTERTNHLFNGYSFTYLVNSSTDTKAPVYNEYSACIPHYDVENNKEDTPTKLGISEYTNWTDADYLKYLTNDTITFNITATDTESGVKGFSVKETLLVNENNIKETVELPLREFEGFKETKEGIFELKDFDYKLRSADGVIKVDFTIYDYNNLKNTITFYLYKKNIDNNSIFILKAEKANKKTARNAVNGIDTIKDNFSLSDFYYDTYHNFFVPFTTTITYYEEGEKENEFGTVFVNNSENKSIDFGEKTIIRKENKLTTFNVKTTFMTGQVFEKQYYIRPSNKNYEYVINPSDGKNFLISIKTEESYTNAESKTYGLYLKMYYKNGDNFTEYNSTLDTWGNNLWTIKNVALNLEKDQNYPCYIDLIEMKKDDLYPTCKIKFLDLNLVRLSTAESDGRIYKLLSPDSEENSRHEPVFPTYTLETKPLEMGTGLYNVNVSYSKSEDSYYTYKFFYIDDNNKKQYPETNSFNVYTSVDSTLVETDGKPYKTGIDCFDPSGFVYATKDDYGIVIDTTKYNNSPFLAFLPKDLYPLETMINYSYFNYEPGKLNLQINILENGIKNPEFELEYWVIPNEGYFIRDDYTYENLKESLTNYTKYTYKFSDSEVNLSGKISINYIVVTEEYDSVVLSKNLVFNNLESDYYTVIFKLTDKTSTRSCTLKTTIISKFKTVFDTQNIIYTDNSICYELFEKPVNASNYQHVSFYADSKWTLKSTDNMNMKHINSKYYGYITLEDSILQNSFLKILPFTIYNETQIGKYDYLSYDNNYYNPIYVYPPYYKGEIEVNKTDVIPGIKGIQVYTDAPALIETVYYGIKLESMDEWEKRGICADVKQIDTDYYYTTAVKSIESGNYYATMVHFADGTKWIGEVKYKE